MEVKHTFYVGDALEILKKLPSESVHCCVTSPPYFGLRDYGVEGQLGLEPIPDCLGWATGTPCGECYVCHIVQVFREVRRVLRKDGTLWLNLGDSYASGGTEGSSPRSTLKGYTGPHVKQAVMSSRAILRRPPAGLKHKDLCGIPWRVAFALQADGWWLRSDIIWGKPNALPESVSDRPTKAHEYVFLLTKSERYFYDADAIRQAYASGSFDRYRYEFRNDVPSSIVTKNPAIGAGKIEPNPLGRNKRSVWIIPTQPFPEAHFATFPPALVEPCIKAGTSEYGCCPKCGAPWERVAEKVGTYREQPGRRYRPSGVTMRNDVEVHGGRIGDGIPKIITGWRPTCPCGIEETVPCVVLDPFGGAGTVSLVAKQLGRASIYIDLNPAYAEMAIRRCGFGQQGLFEQHVYQLVKGGVA